MSRKDKRNEELDTETTIVDMNVDGFRWYDKSAKKRNNLDEPKTVKRQVSRKEYWQMVRGMFAAVLPFALITLAVFAILGGLAYWWLS